MPHLPREHSRFASLQPLGRLLLLLTALPGLLAAASDPQHHVTAVRFWSLGDVTRVAIETDGEFETLSDHLSEPERIFFDLSGTVPALGSKNLTVIPVGDKLIQQIRVAEPRKNVTRVVLDLTGVADVSTSRLENPNRLIIEVWQPGHSKAAVAKAAAAPAAVPPAPVVPAPAPPAAVAKPAVAQIPVAQPPVFEPIVEPAPVPPASTPEPPTAAAQVAPAPIVQTVARIEPRKYRPFVPPAAKAAAPSNRVQVMLLQPPMMHLAPTASASLNARLATTTRNTFAPPPVPAVAASAPEFASQGSEDVKDTPPLPVTRVVATSDVTDSAKRSGDASPGTKVAAKRPASPDAALPAKRNSTGDRSMIRVLGLKVGRIVLDPGHGGHDTGTIGPEGLREKDLVLDVSKRLGALIEDRMGSEVIYTRSDDTFIPLERRTEIANEAKADLFLSIHANSSTLRTAAGVETYYLSFTTSQTALDLAARENAGSQETVYDLQDLLQKIALKDKVEESRDFATRVQTALFALSAKTNVRAKDRGIKKAPFVVLIGANMPSVLAEVGFISNAHDETTMKRQEYRERIAEALYKGVSGYASTLSHFQVAQHHSSSSP
jgi:N-acetylmuramoyl-L-alanine amidase